MSFTSNSYQEINSIIMRQLYKTISIVFILFSQSVIMSCNNKASEEVVAEEHHEEEENTIELTEAQLKSAGVALGKIERRQISGTAKVNGVLDEPPQQLI